MKHYGWIPEQPFEVGDVVTYQPTDGREAPLFRLITEVRVHPPEIDDENEPSDRTPRRFYTWEYLDRGIDHGSQHRDDESYRSEDSSDPQFTYFRRVLRGAIRP